MLPACGQGALCIECREDDKEIHDLIAELNDRVSALCVHTERKVNVQLGGNCHVPLAVYCYQLPNQTLTVKAKILSLDGLQVLETNQEGSFAEKLSQTSYEALLAQGAAKLLESI